MKLNLDIILKCSSDMLLTFLLGTFSHLCFSTQSSMQFWKMMQAVYHDILCFYVVFVRISLYSGFGKIILFGARELWCFTMKPGDYYSISTCVKRE